MARASTRKSVTKSPVAPAIIMASNSSDAMEHVNQQSVGDVSLTPDNEKQFEGVQEIEVTNNLYSFNEKADMLKFMEEKVTINIAESTDPNAPSMIFCSVNGEGAGFNGIPWLPRGMDIVVKRKHVERLCRAKTTRYESKERMNAAGEREIYYPSRTALANPFVVVEDTPKGRQWLRGILAE